MIFKCITNSCFKGRSIWNLTIFERSGLVLTFFLNKDEFDEELISLICIPTGNLRSIYNSPINDEDGIKKAKVFWGLYHLLNETILVLIGWAKFNEFICSTSILPQKSVFYETL